MKTSVVMFAAAVITLGMSSAAMAAGDVAAGEDKSKACAGCHGKGGEGKGKNPPIAGMAAADFVKAMQDYSSGARDNKSMARVAKKLSDADVENLAAYYASLK